MTQNQIPIDEIILLGPWPKEWLEDFAKSELISITCHAKGKNSRKFTIKTIHDDNPTPITLRRTRKKEKK